MAKETKEPKLDKAEALPEQIDELDALKYEKLQLQMNNLDLTKQLIQSQLQAIVSELNSKYKLGEQDTVDMQTRKITRKA